MAEASAIVVIPGGSMPWKCTVNGVTYVYEAGAEVEEDSLPLGVRAEIKAYWAAQKAQEASGGSTGGGSTGGGGSGGIVTLILTPESDVSTQSSTGSVTKLSYSCNMAYAQAKAAILELKPAEAFLLINASWYHADAVKLTEAYIMMMFPDGVNVFWDETGFYTGEPSAYNPTTEVTS